MATSNSAELREELRETAPPAPFTREAIGDEFASPWLAVGLFVLAALEVFGAGWWWGCCSKEGRRPEGPAPGYFRYTQ